MIILTNQQGDKMKELKRDDVVAKAREFIDVKFRHQGRSNAGVDCAGLLFVVAWELGIDAEDINGYRLSPEGYDMRNFLESALERRSIDAIEKGDIVHIFYKGERIPHHLAIAAEYQGRLTLIHSLRANKKVIEQTLDEHLHSQICGVYKFPGVIG
jgi:hypothetical protein